MSIVIKKFKELVKKGNYAVDEKMMNFLVDCIHTAGFIEAQTEPFNVDPTIDNNRKKIIKLKKQNEENEKEIDDLYKIEIFNKEILPMTEYIGELLYIFSDYVANGEIDQLLNNKKIKFSIIKRPIYFVKLFFGTDKLFLHGQFLDIYGIVDKYPTIAKKLGISIEKGKIIIKDIPMDIHVYENKINNGEETLYDLCGKDKNKDNVLNYLTKNSSMRSIFADEHEIPYAELFKVEIQVFTFNDYTCTTDIDYLSLLKDKKYCEYNGDECRG